MTDTRGGSKSSIRVLRRSWATLHLHWRALMAAASARSESGSAHDRLRQILGEPSTRMRGLAIGAGIATCLVAISTAGLWWRLASGPLSVDMVTPWLVSAIEARFGGRHQVEVGGTQIERTDEGNTALRLRDIVVRDRDGTVVASAPKAEVGISGARLLLGQLRPQRLSLIGAAMAVRIERDGQIVVFAGADKRPITVSPPASAPPRSTIGDTPPAWDSPGRALQSPAPSVFATLLARFDQLDALGLDGRGLTEIGLKSGSIIVDDRRSGKYWTFEKINLSLTRPPEGGISLALNSTGTDGPWSLAATVTPQAGGHRLVEAIARDVSPKDLLLALRLGDSQIDANTPISAVIRAEFAADAAPLSVEGQVVVGAGHIGDPADPDARILLDEAQLKVRWDAARRLFVVPIEIAAGSNHISLLGQVEPPREWGVPWAMAITGGKMELKSDSPRHEPALMLDRVAVSARLDPAKHRLELTHGEIGGMAASVAFSGAVDFSGTETTFALGLAGTPMTAAAMRRLWPAFIATKLREWVGEHVLGGSVERIVIAVNAPLSALKPNGPPVPDEGLSVDIVSNGTIVQPFDALPATIRDADLTAHVTGRTATVKVGRGNVFAPSGRKLALSNGVFEVPDTHPQLPPARVRLRLDGPIDAVAELAGLAPLRQAAGMQIDPATSRGSFTAQVALGVPLARELPKGSVTYAVDADVSNLAVERMVRGYKLEAQSVRVSANMQGVQLKGDVRIGGTPAAIDYRKPPGDADAEIRLHTTLDDAARARFGSDLGALINGPIPLKINGRIGAGDRESRFAVDADLAQAKITELFPGWSKAPGKPTRAAFVFVDRARTFRFEDLVVEGSGTLVKGTVEVDSDGEVVLANFPTFVLSDGDKASLKAERASDGTMKVTMRGDVYDGRGFVKGAMSGSAPEKGKPSARDVDLDIKVGALAGFNGEALRGVDLRLSRRAGQIRTFSLNAKLGREAALVGDLRAYNNGRQVVFLETNDAGALFRFTDTYPRIFGGRMWVAMDPPTADRAPQEGILHVNNFAIRGESVLERVAAGAPADAGSRAAAANAGVYFTEMRANFTRSPGKLAVRDGVVRGPSVGASIEGQIDYGRDDVRLRGIFVPAYALNNVPGQLPILGFFLGGPNEGLFGTPFEVVGSPHAPTLRANLMGTLAPGILRKPFEFRNFDDNAPTRDSSR